MRALPLAAALLGLWAGAHALSTAEGVAAAPWDKNGMRELALRAAREAQVPPALMLSVGEQESEHRPNPPRRRGDGTGPMQIKPGTWRQYGCSGARGVVLHEYRCGARILAALLREYRGDWCLAAQAYTDGTAGGRCPRKASYAEQVLLRIQYWEMQAAVRGDPRLIAK